MKDLYMDSMYRYFQDFYVHVGPMHFIVLAMMSILIKFVFSQMTSRNPRTQCRVVCYIRGISL